MGNKPVGLWVNIPWVNERLIIFVTKFTNSGKIDLVAHINRMIELNHALRGGEGWPDSAGRLSEMDKKKEHVVIVGGGFGGLYAAKAMKHAPVNVTLVDRRNFHLFQPLLYQVATGSLSPEDIASPLRATLKGQKNAQFLTGQVIDIDPERKVIILEDGDEIGYDALVVATGASHHYFGHDVEWEDRALGQYAAQCEDAGVGLVLELVAGSLGRFDDHVEFARLGVGRHAVERAIRPSLTSCGR